MSFLNEAHLEAYLMEELAELGFAVMHGAATAPDTSPALRVTYHATILEPLLLQSLKVINPMLPERL